MSAYCNKYPGCGCTGPFGTKCNIEDCIIMDMEQPPAVLPAWIGGERYFAQQMKDAVLVNSGFEGLIPEILKQERLAVGNTSEDAIEEAKRLVDAECNRIERGGKAQRPHKKYGNQTNYTPPKKKRRK